MGAVAMVFIDAIDVPQTSVSLLSMSALTYALTYTADALDALFVCSGLPTVHPLLVLPTDDLRWNHLASPDYQMWAAFRMSRFALLCCMLGLEGGIREKRWYAVQERYFSLAFTQHDPFRSVSVPSNLSQPPRRRTRARAAAARYFANTTSRRCGGFGCRV
jgi:hypothetical protein